MAWAAVIIIDGLSLFGIGHLRYESSLVTELRSETSWYQSFLTYRDAFTQSDADVAVLFQSPDFAEADRLETVANFAIEAQFIDNVVATHSIFSVRDREDYARPYLPAELPPRPELVDRLAELADAEANPPRLISGDRRMTMVLVSFADGGAVYGGSRATLSALEALADDLTDGTDVTVALTGLSPIRERILQDLFEDLVTFNVIGIVAGTLVCIVALGLRPLAFLTLLPAGTALMWVMGAMAALGYAFNVLTVVLPVLILVLAFTDSLHLTFEARRLDGLSDPLARMRRTIVRVGPACALASVTTAVAFAGLFFSSSQLIREMAAAGMVGTLVALATVLIVHPLIFATALLFAPAETIFGPADRPPPRVFRMTAFYQAAMRYPRAIALVSGVALVGALVVYPTIQPRYLMLDYIDDNAPQIAALQAIDDNLTPTGTIDVLVTLPAGGTERISPEGLARIEAVHASLKKAAPGGVPLSLAPLAALGGDEAAPAEAAARVNRFLGDMPEVHRRRFLSDDGTLALVRLYLTDDGAVATRARAERISAAFARDGVAQWVVDGPTGLMVMSAFVSGEMIMDLNWCFLIAVSGAGVLVAVWFRSLSFGLVALIPNVLPIALVGAFLAASGFGLRFASGIALTIAFGIAVDDTAHLLNRLRLNTSPGNRFSLDAIRRSVEEVAPVLAMTTAILSLGLLGTFLSHVPSVREFGLLSIVVFLLALAADVVVLPAWLVVLGWRPGARQVGRGA